MAIIAELHHATQQRNIPSAEILDTYSSLTQEHFDIIGRRQHTPVVIPARDEQHDLPHLLLSAAQSDWPLLPVVVENGSTDNTLETAKIMGAHTLQLARASKVAATLEGSLYAREHLGANHALYTDADALLTRNWGSFMCRNLVQLDTDGTGAMYVGGIMYAHGESSLTDTILSVRHIQARHRTIKSGQNPLVVGANYGLSFDRGGRILRTLASIDPNIFIGDDLATRDAMISAGVRVAGDASLQSTVLVRGDRLHSVRSLIGGPTKRRAARLASYHAQYGDTI